MEIKPRIFIASSTEGRQIASAIQHNLQHDAFPEPWFQTAFELSGNVLDSLLKRLGEADAAIFVFTPDDVANIRDDERMIARDNVVLELGMFVGRLGKNVCFIVSPQLPADKDMHFPTDLQGLTHATYNVEHAELNPMAALGPACDRIKGALREHLHLRFGALHDDRVIYFLRGIKESYLRYLSEEEHKPFVRSRLNIMAPSKRDAQNRSMLQIVYADYLEDYDEEELEDGWYVGQGKCGKAWQEGKQAIYAPDIHEKATGFVEMGEDKSENAHELRSVLSTPIVYKEQLIAILNLDSERPGKETRIHTVAVGAIFENSANKLGPLLYETIKR